METFNHIIAVITNPTVGFALATIFAILSAIFGTKFAKINAIRNEMTDAAKVYHHVVETKRKALSNGVIDPQEKAELEEDEADLKQELVDMVMAFVALGKK